MKLSLIAPTQHLDLTLLGHMHFVLAQRVLTDEVYASFYAKTRKYKIMDNGAYEGKLMSTDDILRAANIIRADEIVASDIPFKSTETLKLTSDFIRVCPKRYKIMGVPHGTSVADYIANFEDMLQLDLDVIGFSILDLWKGNEYWNCYRIRPMVVSLLARLLLLTKEKEFHLLGLDEPIELYCYRKLKIRSVDTSLPFSLAAAGIRFKHTPAKTPRIRDNHEFTKYQLDDAKMNIHQLKRIVRQCTT